MIQKPKGTKDILPQDSYKWQYIEQKTKELFENYGFKEIRVPVFENTELFQRGVGETTDVVQKEMYTFEDKGGRSITLRPEGTAGVVRAYIENGMASLPSPIKLWYNMSMYRYENVQKGRLREFHQIGAEVFGTESYLADVEIILMANEIFKIFNIPNIELAINSIGCPECRKKYQEKLKEYIKPNLDKYCEVCKTRFEKNPMRILDCKEEKCKEYNKNAPSIIEYLCDECNTHFENVKKTLNALNLQYRIDTGIVRGLDYYTKTVFEFISKDEGYTVLAGGRYDGLVKELGGADVPAIGFAMGMERLVEIYEKYNENKIEPKQLQLYITNIGEEANIFATKLVQKLRKENIYAEKDISGKSLKAQFKYADKKNAKYCLTIGETEVISKKAKIKNMETGEEKQIELLQEQIKSMNEVMVKMLEKDNPKVETEEDRRNKLIEETRSHTEELNKKLEQRERNHNIAYKAKKLGEVVNNFGERVFTMDYLNTLSGFAIDEAYDNYFQDGNCKVGTKKLSDEELEKYEILFEGKKPKEEKKNEDEGNFKIKEVETDEKTKIAEGFDKNINEKDPLNNLEEEKNDEKKLSDNLIESSEKEKSKTPADLNEKDKVEAAEKAKEQVKPEGEKNIANVEEASPSLKSKIWNKLKGNLGKVGAIALPLAAIAGLLLGGIGWTAIAATAPATLAAFAGGYVAKKSGLIK